jgi:glycosyltransferase involved in cell wall biosynthesis
MRVFMNFRAVRGPYGGANAFLRALKGEFARRGVKVVHDVNGRYDVALLNALTDGIDADFARRIAERGIPIVHRKVGYRVSGSPEMRAPDPDGVIHGDRLQLDFSPYIRHTVFQSSYSRDVFAAGGSTGDYTIIHNGVDESIFNQSVGLALHRRQRPIWRPSEPLRVAISTWSTDPNKGFDDYALVDRSIASRDKLTVTLFGSVRAGVTFENVRAEGPYRRRRLASRLKEQHVLLQLARWETCSNALIEGINCGLPAIYLDSGSNKEIAELYGLEYTGDIGESVELMSERYADLQERTRTNPYRITLVAPRYLEVLESVL